MSAAVSAPGGAIASLDTLQIRTRRANAVLDRRALGLSQASIARDLDLGLPYVRDLILKRRERGDDRALTDAQAAFRLADLAAQPPAAKPGAPSTDTGLRYRVAARLRVLADRWMRRGGEDAADKAAGLEHLADLWEHHGPRLYPSLPIHGSDVVLTFVQPQLQHSACGSSALQCMDGA